jgi:electron transport complex protein RnfD
MIRKFPAPHIRREQNGELIFPHVLIALAPCYIAAIYYYGIRALFLIAFGMVTFTVSDYLCVRFMRKETYVWDASSLVSGAILTLILPPTISIWTLLIGILFASVIVKQCFGGLGSNLFNPALAACAFLSIAFPAQVSSYTEPMTSRFELTSLLTGPVDVISSATPAMTGGETGIFELLSGRYAGAMGETCTILILASGVYLVRQGILRVQAPIAYLVVVFAGYWMVSGVGASLQGAWMSIITGGVIFGAVFAMGDYTTTPVSRLGRILFGIGAGLLTLLTQRFGNPSFAVGFSILAMNLVTPILDLYIRPRVFSKPVWYASSASGANDTEMMHKQVDNI